MAKRNCGPSDSDPAKKQKATKKATGGGGGKKKVKGPKRVPNMFILYYMEMYKKHGGNMYCVARECGRRWNAMSAEEKEKYKRMYCALCKKCKSCNKGSSKGSSSSGSRGGKGKKC